MAQPRDKKRSDAAGISDVTGNFQLKPGLICRVFVKDLFVEPFTGPCMTFLYLQALLTVAVSLSVLMSLAWVVQQRTGNSGWVDTIWTFSLGLVGAGSAMWPVAGAAPNARQWLVAALVAIWSVRLGSHIAVRTTGISDDPRYAAFARE
jgi:steroid 5-alpha reductase family enzyme